MSAAERRGVPVFARTRTPGSLGTLLNKKNYQKQKLAAARLEPLKDFANDKRDLNSTSRPPRHVGFHLLFQVEPIKISTGKWACPYCSKIFNRGFIAKDHIKTHTGEKPYKCNYCNYGTIQKSNYRAHCIRIHGIDIDSHI